MEEERKGDELGVLKEGFFKLLYNFSYFQLVLIEDLWINKAEEDDYDFECYISK